MRKALKKLKGYTGRVMRDLRRQLDDIPEGSLRDRITARLALVSQLLHQQPKGADKIYALHEPEFDCISKGKARVRYEFGCKVSIPATLDEGFIVGMHSFPGNPYDGHTLRPALEQVTILTDQRPDLAVVDLGYRGHGEHKTRVLISGTRRGMTPKLIADLRRRSAIEAEIGHMKADGRLSRCLQKGTIGDALFAVLCTCGHNIRKILAHFRACLVWIIAPLRGATPPCSGAIRPALQPEHFVQGELRKFSLGSMRPTSGRNSMNRAISSASIRSVFARMPLKRAKALICTGGNWPASISGPTSVAQSTHS